MGDFSYKGELARHPADFYSTPEWATVAMLGRVTLNGTTREPACGDGAISKLLPGRVFSTDLHNRGFGLGGVDFLSPRCFACDNPAFPVIENIVTNPPFRLAEKFVWKALSVTSEKVIMLLRLQFPESQQRSKLFRETPLSRVLVFSRRVSCGLNGEEYTGGKAAYAWFVWEHGYEGPPVLEWIP